MTWSCYLGLSRRCAAIVRHRQASPQLMDRDLGSPAESPPFHGAEARSATITFGLYGTVHGMNTTPRRWTDYPLLPPLDEPVHIHFGTKVVRGVVRRVHGDWALIEQAKSLGDRESEQPLRVNLSQANWWEPRGVDDPERLAH